MKPILYMLVSALCMEVASSCSPKVQKEYSKSIECISMNSSSSQVLSVWCGGKHNFTNCDDAVSRVLEQVIFSGTTQGPGRCNSLPIVLNSNSRFDNEEYWRNLLNSREQIRGFAMVESITGTTTPCQNHPHRIVVRVFHHVLTSKLKADSIAVR